MTKSQLQALEDIRDHGDPWRRVRGQAQHGGWHGVMKVIARKRWAAYNGDYGWTLTAVGRKELLASYDGR